MKIFLDIRKIIRILKNIMAVTYPKTLSTSFLLLMVFACPQGAESVTITSNRVNLDVIAKIESNGNPRAVSYRGKKYGAGLHQISETCLKEWNRINKRSKHVKKDLFNAKINGKIANWYLNVRIPEIFKINGIPDVLEHRLIAYNAGHKVLLSKRYRKHGKLPVETQKYIKKYLKLTRKLDRG